MKNLKRFLFLVIAVVMAAGVNSTYAFDLSKLTSSDLGNLINGVISTDKIEVSDLNGTWTTTGPAVSFKSENLLEKAGGAAASATIENKLAPYYKTAGLDGAKFYFNNGAVTITLKKGTKITGTVKKGTTEGTLIFNFNKLSSTSKLGSLTAYVSKGTTVSIMFDATKLQKLVSSIAKLSGNSTAKTASSLLSRYQGIYAGFKMSK